MKKVVLIAFLFYSLLLALADVSTPHLCMPAPSQKCFTVIQNQKLNWLKAEEYCEKNLPNGRLACIHNAFGVSLISGWLSFLTTDPWIGAFKLGSFPYQWVDKTPLDYTNWAQGQPTQNCAQICHSSGTSGGIQCQQGKWRTAECESVVSQFICEYGNYTDSASTTTTQPTTQSTPTGTDCLDIHRQNPSLKSGIYLLSPQGTIPFQAYCDMETDGGGWTVFQRRVDDAVSFYDKTWNEYKYGFNNGLEYNNLWLGNEYIHLLSTKDANVDLRIDLWGDRVPDTQHSYIYLWQNQSSFYIDNEANNYTLHLSTILQGNASISGEDRYGINFNIGQPFSTKDRNNNIFNNDCSRGYQLGGWWFDNQRCTDSSLNGKYNPTYWSNQYGFVWYTGNFKINPEKSRMMLRRAS